jgi:hypothetical protein
MAAPPDSFTAMLKSRAGLAACITVPIAALATAPCAGQAQTAAAAPLTA